jgi:sigma-B regulation protein RsbU (phosphoserine phosphatase)
VLASINTILHQRQLEEYYCTLCYSIFDLKRRTMTMANSGLPYPVRWSAGECSQIELPGVPLGSFPGSTYDEVTFSLQPGEVYVFCTDGVFEAMNELAQEFTAARLLDVVQRSAQLPAAKIVSAIFQAVAEWRGGAPPNDDMTAVVVRITA